MNQRLTALLHKHFSGLLEFSDLDESELEHLADALGRLEQPDGRTVQRALELSELTHWRLACGSAVWDSQQPASSFIDFAGQGPIDTWREGAPLIPPCLLTEIAGVL
jgi:hypothetical protein